MRDYFRNMAAILRGEEPFEDEWQLLQHALLTGLILGCILVVVFKLAGG